MNSFPNKILELRKQKNLTQEELANILHVSRQAISKWETGVSYPSMDILYIIAQVFNVTIDELFDSNDVRINTFKNNKKLSNFKKITYAISILIVVALVIAIISLTTANKAIELNTNDDTEAPEQLLIGFVVITSNNLEQTNINIDDLDTLGYPYYIRHYDEVKNLIWQEHFGVFNINYGNMERINANVYVDANKYRFAKVCSIYKNKENGEISIDDQQSWMAVTLGSFSLRINKEVTKEEINYDVTVHGINTLENVRLIEYGLNNNIIAEQQITNSDTEYTLSKDCLYIVIENKFVNSKNEYYYKRDVLTSGEINTGYFYNLQYANDFGISFSRLNILPYYYKEN